MTKLEDGTTLRLGVIAGYDYIGPTPASLEATFLDCDEAFYEENGVHIIRYDNDGNRLECINIFYCD